MRPGLKQHTIPVPFAKGIDDNTVDDLKDIKILQTAKNGWFNQDMMFESCNGYSKLDELNSYNLSNTYSYKGTFLTSNGSSLYTYSGLNKFNEIGKIDTLGVESEGVYRSSSLTVTNQDSYTNPLTGVACIVWYENTRGLVYSIYDTTKKSYIVAPTLIDSLLTQARVCYVSTTNSYVIVAAKPSTNEIISYFYNLNTSTLSSPVTMKSNLRSSNVAISVIQYLSGDGVTVGYATTADKLGLFHITRTNTLATSAAGYYDSITDTTISIQKALSLTRVDTDFVVCYNELSTNNIKSKWYGSDFVGLTSIQSLGTITSSTTSNAITAIRTAASTVQVFVDEINATYNYGKLFTCSIAKSSSSSSVSQIFTGAMIAGSAFLNYAGNPVVLCIYKSSLQSSYFALGSNSKINAQFSVGIAGDTSTTAQLDFPTTTQTINSYIYSMLLNKGRLTSESGVFTTLSGIILNKLEQVNYRTSVEMNDSLYISGGIPKVFDGKVVHEAGFTLYPENLSLNASATTTGFISDGTYNYKAVFEYYDATGRLHESKTSTALQIVLSGGTSTQKTTIRVPSVVISEKDSITVSLYRTTNGGTIYYKVSSLSSPNIITPSTNTFIDIVDTLADTTIISNQQLYTTGNLLENAIFPACKVVKNLNGRLWFGICENRRLLYYSQLSNQFQAVKTASELFYDTLEGGQVVGLAEYGNTTAVFKDNGIYVITGSPALNTGSGSTLQPIRKVINNITSTSYRTIYETVNGIFFMSRFGIQLLQYDGSLNNFAKPINDRMNPSDINYIIYVERLKHLRLHLSNTCWVFDYINNSWYEWEYYGATSGVIVNGYEYFTKADGYLRQENDNYSVDSAPITMTLKTGWFRLMPLSVQRVYSIHPILKYFTDHKIAFRLYYNNEPRYSEVFDTQSSSITSSNDLYGSGTYGSGVTYGGDTGYNSVYYPELQPKYQECESVSVEIVVYNNGNSIGKMCGILGLNFVAGVSSHTLQRKQSGRISGS
jgi:hypothetical protein